MDIFINNRKHKTFKDKLISKWNACFFSIFELTFKNDSFKNNYIILSGLAVSVDVLKMWTVADNCSTLTVCVL